ITPPRFSALSAFSGGCGGAATPQESLRHVQGPRPWSILPQPPASPENDSRPFILLPSLYPPPSANRRFQFDLRKDSIAVRSHDRKVGEAVSNFCHARLHN